LTQGNMDVPFSKTKKESIFKSKKFYRRIFILTSSGRIAFNGQGLPNP